MEALAGVSATCATCVMTSMAGSMGGERRLLAWSRKLGGHEGGDDEGGMPAEMMGCFGLGDMSEEQMGVAMIAESIGPDAECTAGDLTAIASMGDDAAEPDSVDAAVAMGITEE